MLHQPKQFSGFSAQIAEATPSDFADESLECAHDIAYDGIETDCALSYNSSFGKICTGEQFRVLFTLMNVSGQHALENLRMRVVVQRVSADADQPGKDKAAVKEEVLMNEVIKILPAKDQMGFIFIFKVDF